MHGVFQNSPDFALTSVTQLVGVIPQSEISQGGFSRRAHAWVEVSVLAPSGCV